MAYLYKRGGTWWLGYDVGGKRFQRSTRCKRKADAKKEMDKVRALESAHKAGILEDVYNSLSGRPVVDRPFLSATAEWFSDLESSVADSTRARYEQIVNDLASFLNANSRTPSLRNVSSDMLSDFLKSKELSQRSIALRHGVITIFFNYCIERKWLSKSPVTKLQRRKKGATGAVQRQTFTMDQVKLIYSKADQDWKDLIILGFFTGMSIGDCVNLKWSAVDLEKGVIVTRRMKTGVDVLVPLTPQLKTVLERRRKHTDGVFPEFAHEYGLHEAKTLSGQFRRIMEAAGVVEKKSRKLTGSGRTGMRVVSPLSFHSFRHTLVSNLRNSGAVSTVSKAISGHKTDAMHDIYTHVDQDSMRKAMDSLPAIDI